MQPTQKQVDVKLKSVKSQKNLGSNPNFKGSCKKVKQKGKQKSLSRKKKKMVETSFEEEQMDTDERRNEYYNKDKRQMKYRNHGGNNVSEYITLASSGKINQKSDAPSGATTKLTLDKVKGVINFDGKFVKNNLDPSGHKSPANWEFSADNYTEILSRQEPRQSKKNKSKSKSKGRFHESKVKNKTKNHDKERHSSNRRVVKRTPHTDGDTFQDTTKNTPYESTTYQRNQQVDLESTKKQLLDDRSKMMKINLLKKVAVEKRSQCIHMLSRICGEMQFRKDVFALSVQLFDSYLNDQVLISKHKLLGLACLIVALKLQQAENANIFYVQLSAVNSKVDEGHRQKERSVEDGKQAKSLGKQKGKKKDKGKEKGKEYEGKEHKQDKIFQKFKILKIILRDQMQEGINKTELFQFQTMILLKQDFRVCKRTYTFWVDMFTMLWDQYILEDRLDSYGSLDSLLFRCIGRTKNYAYLNQILESSLHTSQFYTFNQAVIVMSTMYLLLRINMEGDQQGFENYRKNLQKSSNALFVDRAGVNEVFGEFLSKIQMQMGQILPCCQFLSSYLNRHIFIDFIYENFPCFKFDHALGIHFHNPKLYPSI